MKRRIGFLTCQSLANYFPSTTEPLFTHDDQLAAEGLRKRGLEVVPVVWGASHEQLQALELALLIVRSPWDYASRRQEFVDWLEGVASLPLLVENPISLMLWNLDKYYLQDLARCGVPVVETVYLAPEQAFEPQEWLARWGGFVVKPCISAAAKDTFRIRCPKEAQQLVDGHCERQQQTFATLRHGRHFMVQPYLEQVEQAGEWSLVFINGCYSHAVLKKPKAGGWLVQDELGGSVHCVKAPPAAIELAESAFEKIIPAFYLRNGSSANPILHPPLYGRIDIVPSQQGLRVGEIELIEPELFFLDRTAGKKKALESAITKFYEGVIARLA